MSECKTQLEFDEDARTSCKYGTRCYQKNPLHHEKFKHPPKRHAESEEHKHISKKPKTDSDEKPKKDDSSSNDTSESSVQTSSSTHNTSESKDLKDDLNSSKDTEFPQDPVKQHEDIENSLSDEDFIKEKFLVSMPKDFYSFWDFCVSLNDKNPLDALKDCELLLVGPFDVLAKKFKKYNKSPNEFLRHWRYYYDPPEFQTIIKGDDKVGYHIGYFRDSPNEDPVFVASNHCGLDDCEICPMAENMFGAINDYLDSHKQKCDPFKKLKVSKLQTQLVAWASEHSFSLDRKTEKMKSRNSKVVAKTFNRAGIVVPYNKKTQLGYRPLIENERTIKKLLKLIIEAKDDTSRDLCLSKLQPIITMASIAADECDFGTGLELGLDLFAYGGEIFHGTILSLLVSSYTLLNRNDFAKIIKAHLEDRKKEVNLSILS